jgi:ubiquinone biosynthesis protein UbiJ
MMIDKRARNPGDLVKYYSELIMEERRKIAESMAAIAEYADQLRRVADDTERRLLTRD